MVEWQTERHRAALASEFLRTHKIAYSFSFKHGGGTYWQGFFANEEELEDAQVRFLTSIDYSPRRFWEFWRRGETKPSEPVLERLAALKQHEEAGK